MFVTHAWPLQCFGSMSPNLKISFDFLPKCKDRKRSGSTQSAFYESGISDERIRCMPGKLAHKPGMLEARLLRIPHHPEGIVRKSSVPD